MTTASRVRLAVLSGVALFVELALIRYVGSEVKIFAYFKNLVLIACFLGFGLGFFRARAAARLGPSLIVLGALLAGIRFGPRFGQFGPESASVAFSNFAGSLTMGEEAFSASSWGPGMAAGLGWTLILLLSCIAVLYGFAQRIGSDIEAFGSERRLQAYSWNVAGSLAGILAFAFVSRMSWGPLAWFVPAIALTAPFLPASTWRGAAIVEAGLVAVILAPQTNVIWSPYQKLEIDPSGTEILVDGTGYMSLRTFKHPLDWEDANGVDRWRLPHTLHPGARSVLVVGAGAGNDVSAALEAGAGRVVAVEIDPEIYHLGAAHHVDAPYRDRRVEVVVDDARHFGETCRERFDLIVFSHLDAHTALSGFTNIRLDNYIYTVESFRTFRRLLAPDGMLYVSFWATRDWVALRLRENLFRAFGQPPESLYRLYESQGRPVRNAYFAATDDEPTRERARATRAAFFEPWSEPEPPEPSTDDWPYLFAFDRHVPRPQLLLAQILGLVVAGFIALLIGGEMKRGGGWPFDRHFFFMGAGFLLVEVHNVGRLARAFGTTWSVNAWVVSGILLVILAANFVAIRRPALAGGKVMYALLIASLLAAGWVPVNRILAAPLGPLIAVAFYTAPLLFAGLIFAGSFRRAAHPMRALGSNILGALLGGFLELLSFVTGLPGLPFVAAGLYGLSYRRSSE